MIDDEQRIREEAHKLWVAEGRPKGRAEEHWAEAKEIIAIKDSNDTTLRPVEETVDEPAEPAIAFENQGDMPGLDDLGDSRTGPNWDAARETAKLRPLQVEDAPESKGSKGRKRSAQRDEPKLRASTEGAPQKD